MLGSYTRPTTRSKILRHQDFKKKRTAGQADEVFKDSRS